MRLVWIVLAVIATLINIACSNDPNSDAVEEVACSASTGTWHLTSVSCNGASQAYFPSSITINSATSATGNLFVDACKIHVNFAIAADAGTSALPLTGAGTVTCSADGTTVSSCDAGSLGIYTCNDALSADGLDNSFSSCVVSSATMTMSRTVTADQASNLSMCAEGEIEQLTYSTTQPAPTALVVSLAAGTIDYGSVAAPGSSSQILPLTNIGEGNATALSGNVNAPFEFTGGTYPGTSGTCTATLAPFASCNVDVSFSPSAAGSFSEILSIIYNDGASLKGYTFSLSGTGT